MGESRSLSIWGSCVSRDTLEAGAHGFEPLRYHARTSWIAQASPRTPPPVPVPEGAGFGERMVREDLAGEVVGLLLEQQPHVLVLDLIDERFDLVDVAGTWYTMSDYMGRLGVEDGLRQAATRVSRFSDDERQQLYDGAVRRLGPELLARLPQTRFVLHQAWYTAVSADPGQPFYATAARHAAWSNGRLAGHYATLREVLGPRLHVVEAPRELLVGDPAHRWGLAHYHYVPDYYAFVLGELARIADGPVSPDPALPWPSAEPPEGAAPVVPVTPSAGPQRRKRSLRRVAGAVRRRLRPLGSGPHRD